MSSKLVLSDRMSDVVLKLPHGGYSWRFPAHALVLQSRSSQLSEMVDDQPERPLCLVLIGHQPETILAILRYLYCSEVPTEITTDLLVAAEKYGLNHLRDKLEEKVLPTLTVVQACQILSEFDRYQPQNDDCTLHVACMHVIEKHACDVFASDLVLALSRKVLVTLLESDNLNVPDEAIVFWGVWNWGRKYCCQNNKRLENASIVNVIDDMLVLIRLRCVKRTEGIPRIAQKRFNRCLSPRSMFEPPEDSLEQSHSWRTRDFWEDMVDVRTSENLCVQVSFDQPVMLVGLTLEVCAPSVSNSAIQIFRESDREELLRQNIDCFQCTIRKLGRKAKPEPWLRAQILLLEPLFLVHSEIYTIYFRAVCPEGALPRSLQPLQKTRVQGTWVTRHGQGAVCVKSLHFVPNVKATWL